MWNKQQINCSQWFVRTTQKEEIKQAYISKHGWEHSNQVTLLMIRDSQKWHCLTLKRLPKLLRGITSKNSKNCYCVSFIILFKTANKLKSHEDVCKDHDNCLVKMPEARSNILNFNHGEKYLRKLLVIYASTECLLEKNKNKQIKNK